MVKRRAIKSNKQIILLGIMGYIVVFFLFVFFSQETYSIYSRIIAWLVFIVGTSPLLFFMLKKSPQVPLIELVLLAYVSGFCLPVFFQTKQDLFVKTLYPESEPVTLCLLLVLLAVFALLLGYKLAPTLLKGMSFPAFRLDCSNKRLFYYGVFLCLLFITSSTISFGSFQGFFNIIISRDLGVALLALLYYKRLLNHKEKVLVIFLIITLVLKGVASGMTQAMLQPLMVWLICRWLVTKKIELRFIVIAVFLFILIQPVKLEYRGIVWSSNIPLTSIQKIGIFSTLFYDYWLRSNDKEKNESSTSSRTSLLLQTSHVIDWTPSVVPYRNGETLGFMFVTWIPRFLWSNKPIAQQSNIYYAIDYGVSTKEGIKYTMFGVGHLGEVFMNFGVLGIVPVYLLLGILTYIPIYFLGISKNSIAILRTPNSNGGIATLALFIAILVKFIFIGSTIADSYGGMIQMMIVQGGLLYFFTRKKGRVRAMLSY